MTANTRWRNLTATGLGEHGQSYVETRHGVLKPVRKMTHPTGERPPTREHVEQYKSYLRTSIESENPPGSLMTGLESVAAALGIVDVGLRSVSLLYDSIKELRSAPKVIAGLKKEIEALGKCLTGLEELLKPADDSINALVQRFGLPEAVKSCADACNILHEYISKRATTQDLSIRARLHFLVRRKDIMEAVGDISTAKGTTTLTVAMATL